MQAKKQEMTLAARAIEIADNMREAHADFRAGKIKRDDADTIANINGKNLKALAVIIADRMCDLAYMHEDTRLKSIKGESVKLLDDQP